MTKDNNVHMFIGPRISDNMTISELNGVRYAAKYSISRDFANAEDFNKFCGQFKNEKELLDAIYGKDETIRSLFGDDLTKDLCVLAYDKDKNPIIIPYGSAKKLSGKARAELYKWYKEKMKKADSYAKERDLKRRQNER